VLRQIWQHLRRDPLGLTGVGLLTFFVLVAIFAPVIAPYDPEAILRLDGEIARLHPPSREFWFGTTNMGRDIFSGVVLGSRIALKVGILAALLVTFVGTNVGLIAGYYGGIVDTLLMRLVDLLYGIPFIPFVIVLVSLLKPSVTNIILAVSALTWRSVARIVRSQVLTLSQRPFVKAARVAGASDLRIIYRHILPNVLPIAMLEMSFVVSWAIVSEASVSFIGFGDPTVPSWGKLLNGAFVAGAVRFAPWWVAFPGLAIVLLVLAVFFITRSLETVINPRLKGGE